MSEPAPAVPTAPAATANGSGLNGTPVTLVDVRPVQVLGGFNIPQLIDAGQPAASVPATVPATVPAPAPAAAAAVSGIFGNLLEKGKKFVKDHPAASAATVAALGGLALGSRMERNQQQGGMHVPAGPPTAQDIPQAPAPSQHGPSGGRNFGRR